MKVFPYLNFDGNCAEAFDFYARVLGGTIEGKMNYDQAPGGQGGDCPEMPAEMADRVLHVCMRVGDDFLIMGSDCPPNLFEKPQGVYVSLHIDDVERAERVFTALAEGGSIGMPFERTFWAERFGMCVDRFGTPWMVNCAPAAEPAVA